MSYQVFCQTFAPGSWSWLSSDPDGVGMQLDAAFRAFAATVNAHPHNATTPLAVHRNHADGTANHWGFVWELGHPSVPAHVSFFIESPNAQGVVLQGDTQSTWGGIFLGAPATALTDQAANGGYGTYSGAALSSMALAYLDTTSSHSNIGAVLLIAQDTTPGVEFFCWTLKTFGGSATLHRDSCHMVFKSAGTAGWQSGAVFPDNEKQHQGIVRMIGYTVDEFRWLETTFSAAVPRDTQQARSRMLLSFIPSRLQAMGRFDEPPPPIQTPPRLYFGNTTSIGPSLNFGKTTFPDGVMLQLTQRGAEDVWLWVPHGSSHGPGAPWTSAVELSHWQETNRMNFTDGHLLETLQLVPSGADFVRHFPYMSAAGVRQHPQQAAVLAADGSGGGGGTGGSEGGGAGAGGSARPSSGLLWPRRS